MTNENATEKKGEEYVRVEHCASYHKSINRQIMLVATLITVMIVLVVISISASNNASSDAAEVKSMQESHSAAQSVTEKMIRDGVSRVESTINDFTIEMRKELKEQGEKDDRTWKELMLLIQENRKGD